LRNSFRSFQHRNYRLFFASSFITNTGFWGQRVAQDWLILELTHSGTVLGAVTCVQFAPYLFFSLLGGSFADKFNNRKVLTFTSLGGAASAFALGFIALSQHAKIWHVFLLAIATGIAAAVDGPVRQSFVSEIVGADDLSNAVSLNSANFSLGRLIGPALSGYLITLFGTGPSFLLNGSAFLLMIFALVMMNSKEFILVPPKVGESLKIVEGIRYVRGRRDLTEVTVVMGAMSLFGLNFHVNTALMTSEVFLLGPASFGFLGTCIAMGAVSGSLICARMEQLRGLQIVLRTAFLFGVLSVVASVMPTFMLFALTLPVIGALNLITIIAATYTMQMTVESSLRGRVMGLYLLVFMGGTTFGAPLMGWFAEATNPRYSIAAGGAVTALFVCGVLAMRRLRPPAQNEL